MEKEIIFGIGLPRTGTTSLASALTRLGYVMLHDPKNLDLDFYDHKTYSGFTDTPIWWPDFFIQLEQKFPNAKFINTYRPVDKWIKSIERFGYFKFQPTKIDR